VLFACLAQDISAEKLIEAGHWKRARAIVEARLKEAPDDPNATFLLSQIRNAFGDQASPLGLAEKAVRLEGRVARYHRQIAEVQGVMAQHAGMFQQVGLARRFRKEIDTALALDPRDKQALRDLLEFYLLAPGILGGDVKKAVAVSDRISAIDACDGYLAKARVAEHHKDRAEQETMLKRAAGIRPASYRAQIALAEYDKSAAEALARTAIEIDPARADAYCILASVYAARGNWDTLDALLSSASAAVPDDLTAYYRAAERLLADNREPLRAERYLRIYLSQPPEGNRPTAADAARELKRIRTAVPADASNITRPSR
jgi:tetratricopeptide (TPR) repeat protein